jgi:AcrR family transcriptional regulator
MAKPAPIASRRRSTDIEEIKALALRQLERGTLDGFSLSGIARELGLSSPALYRYVAGRDELVSELLSDAFEDFGGALEAAVAGRRRPETALRAAAAAYRAWAEANPARYQLCMGSPLPGYTPPPSIVAQGHRSLGVLVRLVADILKPTAPPAVVLNAAAQGWARLHGFVSLELAGHLAVLGVRPDAVFDAEVRDFLADLHARRTR